MIDWLLTAGIVLVVFALPFAAGWAAHRSWAERAETRRREEALAREAQDWLEARVAR